MTSPQMFVRARAEAAADALGYRGHYDHDHPGDLIADLMHYAASRGMDPFAEVDSALYHFRAETDDPYGDGTNEDGEELARAPRAPSMPRPLPCATCGAPVHPDAVNWARPDGSLSVDDGAPYCDGCLPPEVAA